MTKAMGMTLGTGADPVAPAVAQRARVADVGSAHHRHVAALVEASGRHAGRDLADAVHLLCFVHGRHPSLIDLARRRSPEGPVGTWLERAGDAFERERLYLVRLTAAVGPIPSTPGAAQTEASLTAARHALETLATSERRGCALGAATALIGDWWPLRRLLDRAASRTGIEPPPPGLPDEASVTMVIGQMCDGPAASRALSFGGEQLLLQHRALLDLLEARAEARGEF